LLWLN
jgi:transposase